MFNNMPTWLKAIFALIGSILIGAIGSGVWEKVLSPFLNLISNGITSILSALSSTYSDSLYTSASNLYYTNNSYLLIIYILTFVLFIYALSSKRENRIVNHFYNAMISYAKGWFGIVFTGALLIISIYGMTRSNTINAIASYSLKQMEILRPYIGEQKYLQLRSDYLQMQNKKDFEHFLQDMYQASATAHIKIKKFE